MVFYNVLYLSFLKYVFFNIKITKQKKVWRYLAVPVNKYPTIFNKVASTRVRSKFKGECGRETISLKCKQASTPLPSYSGLQNQYGQNISINKITRMGLVSQASKFSYSGSNSRRITSSRPAWWLRRLTQAIKEGLGCSSLQTLPSSTKPNRTTKRTKNT